MKRAKLLKLRGLKFIQYDYSQLTLKNELIFKFVAIYKLNIKKHNKIPGNLTGDFVYHDTMPTVIRGKPRGSFSASAAFRCGASCADIYLSVP